jgi:hypothetical protein
VESFLQPPKGTQWATSIEVLPIRVQFKGERYAFVEMDEDWMPRSNTAVYALGQPELGYVLDKPRGAKPYSYFSSYSKPLEGIPFYSVHKTTIGEQWQHSNSPADVYAPNYSSLLTMHRDV